MKRRGEKTPDPETQVYPHSLSERSERSEPTEINKKSVNKFTIRLIRFESTINHPHSRVRLAAHALAMLIRWLWLWLFSTNKLRSNLFSSSFKIIIIIISLRGSGSAQRSGRGFNTSALHLSASQG